MGIRYIKLNGTKVVGIYSTKVSGSSKVTDFADYTGQPPVGKMPELHQVNGILEYQLANEPVVPTVVEPTYVPSSITRVQTMKQLKVLGQWTAFKAVLATNVDAQDEWDLATELQRANPFVAMLAPALNMTNADIDTLFIEASKL